MSKTNDTTKQIVECLNNSGYIAWRQNNTRAVKGRTFKGKKGVPDIIGFSLICCIFTVVEVKTGNDKLSKEQYNFLSSVKNSGGNAYVAKSLEHFYKQFRTEPEPFENFITKKELERFI